MFQSVAGYPRIQCYEFEPAGGGLFLVGSNGVTHEHGNRNRADASRNGSDPACNLFHAVGVDVADDYRGAVRSRDLINADINDGGSRLNHIGAEEFGLSDRNEHGIRPTRVRRNRPV